MDFFLYADTAFHHEGDFDYLKKLVKSAKESGCSGVKFQILIDLNDFMSSLHPTYIRASQWIFSAEQWADILEYTYAKKMKIIAMPCDVSAVMLLKSLQIPIDYYHLHSVNFRDFNIHEAIKPTQTPVILGVGGLGLEEIIFAKKYFRNQLITLMVGFQDYPSDLKDVKLKKIVHLSCLFPDCRIGYADHTSYESEFAIKSVEYAYLLGARVFEKHFTLEEGNSRVDFESAIGSEKMLKINENLKYLDDITSGETYEQMLLSNQEINYRKRQKILVAKEPIRAGKRIVASNTTLKMTDCCEGYTNFLSINGKIAATDISYDEAITQEKILN